MSDIAIRVEGLGKEYRIGQQERYRALRDRLAEGLAKPFNLLRGARNGHKPSTQPDRIWALKDVSFEIRRGEAVGVIGRNGAGKSTLLKILSRIVDPTEGRAAIQGRVGSLLEVGTGFHPELTGRENVYLSGSIIGMKKAEIDRRFDEIVAFAEVEKFVDTMVKYYSSGMYLRLAFAVAAHLEPEILLVDEVLAVGDHRFQERCIGKMQDVAGTGRTVLFVSHNMSAIQRLCDRALLFSQGELQLDSTPSKAISNYLNTGVAATFSAPSSPRSPSIINARAFLEDESIQLCVQYRSPYPLSAPALGFVIYDSGGAPVVGTNTRVDSAGPFPATTEGSFRVVVPSVYFRPGRYTFSLWLGDQFMDYCAHDAALQIAIDGEDSLPAHRVGCIKLPVQWHWHPQAANGFRMPDGETISGSFSEDLRRANASKTSSYSQGHPVQ